MSLVCVRPIPYNPDLFKSGVQIVVNVSDFHGRPLPLKPFLLRLGDGFLLGLAMDPGKGSPCSKCAERWLRQRQVAVEAVALSELRVRRELIADLISENTPHAFYEIHADGAATRLEGLVFPHPECQCTRSNYIAPPTLSKKTNFAFSPLFQIKHVRYTTPEGNLWFTTASGHAPLSQNLVTVFAVEKEKETCRARAVDEWLKRAAYTDLSHRLEAGENFHGEVFQTEEARFVSRAHNPELLEQPSAEGLGVGADRDQATLDALCAMAKTRTLKKFAGGMKNPMLIVGANNWLRSRVPFFVLQQYDLHPLFYPNSTPSWVVGIAAFSRLKADETPIFLFGADADVNRALEKALHQVLGFCRPSEGTAEILTPPSRKQVEALNSARRAKLNLWWTHWIYRCPKISLRDVLHLEAYPKTVAHWREYFRDGQESLTVIPINHALLPGQIRQLVKIHSSAAPAAGAPNINGIATLADFRNAWV